MWPNKPLFFQLPLGKAVHQSQGTHLAAVLLCRMNFKKRRTDKQGWLTKGNNTKNNSTIVSVYIASENSHNILRCHHWFPCEMSSVRNKLDAAEISYWCQLCHYPDQGSAFDWLKRILLKARSIRSPTQFSGSSAEAFLMDTVTLYKLGSYQNYPQ